MATTTLDQTRNTVPTFDTISETDRAAFLAHMVGVLDLPADEIAESYVTCGDPDVFATDYAEFKGQTLGSGDVDSRTDSQRKLDELVGRKTMTGLDRQFAKCLKSATKLFGNKRTRDYLIHGEDDYGYVQMYVSGGGKRSDATARLTELYHESGFGIEDIRVNDYIAVFGLARLCTGCDSVADMPPEWVGGVAYRTLAMLKVGIERDDTDYVFKNGWGGFIMSAIADGLKGRKLTEAIDKHAEYVKGVEHTNARKGLSPERVAQLDAQEASKERDKQITAINKAAENIRDKALEANLSPEDLLFTLVNRGVIQPPKPESVAFTPDEAAKVIDSDFAAKLGHAMCQRGDYKAIMALSGVLSGWLKAQAVPA